MEVFGAGRGRYLEARSWAPELLVGGSGKESWPCGAFRFYFDRVGSSSLPRPHPPMVPIRTPNLLSWGKSNLYGSQALLSVNVFIYIKFSISYFKSYIFIFICYMYIKYSITPTMTRKVICIYICISLLNPLLV